VDRFSLKDFEVAANTLNSVTSQRQSFVAQANPQVAQRLGDIYRQYPMLPAGVALSAAKAGLSDDAVKQIAERAYKVAETNPDALNGPDAEPKSFMERNLWSKLRTGSRWTTAALNLPVELIQGGASQFFTGRGEGVKGWFASTELGTMVMEDERSGSGFFVGGEAKKNQGRRAREFRGEIGGHAWTIGRGSASLFLPENSTAFNLVSGLVDGALTLAVPAVPGAKQAGAALQGAAAAGKGGAVVETAADIASRMGRTGSVIDPTKAQEFLQSGRGQRLITNLMNANTIDDVYKATNDGLFLDTAVRLRDAKSEAEVAQVLGETLGIQKGLSTTLLPGAGRTYQSKKALTDVVERFPGLNRQVSLMPDFNVKEGHAVLNLSASAPQDKVHTMRQLSRWLTQFKVADDVRVQVLDEAASALSGPTASPTVQKALQGRLKEVFKQSLVDNGVNPAVADAILARQRVIQEVTKEYNLDAAGKATDGGFFTGLAGEGDQIAPTILGGPQLASELMNVTLDMPDPRVIRRLTAGLSFVTQNGETAFRVPFGAVAGKTQRSAIRRAEKAAGTALGAGVTDAHLAELARAGQLRMPFVAVDWVQDKWRATTLATLAYSMRNLIEGQSRLALNPYGDNTSFFKHPLQHIMWAATAKGKGDILGETWDGKPWEVAARATQREFGKAVGNAVGSYYNDPVSLYAQAERSGSWQVVQKGKASQSVVVQGHGDQIGKLNADLGARAIAAGLDDDQIKALVGYGGQTPDQALLARLGVTEQQAKDWFRDVSALHEAGRPTLVQNSRGDWAYSDTVQSVDLGVPENFALYLNETRQRVATMTGNDVRLLKTIERGLLPPVTDVVKEIGVDDIGEVRLIPVKDTTGKTVGSKQVRIDAVNPDTGEVTYRAFAFTRGESTTDLRNLLSDKSIYDNPNLPSSYGWETRTPEFNKKGTVQRSVFDETMNRYFAFIYGKPSAVLERSPAFRQQYYRWVDQLLPSLKQEEVVRLAENVRSSVAQAKASNILQKSRQLTEGDYVGSDKLWKRIEEYASGNKKSYNTLTLDEIDQYAKGNALDDLKEMLYDASERNNLTDIARIVMPFVQAQVDFFKALGRAAGVRTADGLVVPNLTNLRRGQLIVDNGIDADPFNTGHGFFYTDPQSGEWSFSYPLFGPLAKLATGMGVQGISPVKGLLLGFDFRPGLGPVGQFAASRILPDSPQFDEIRNFILPYGETAFKGESTPSQLYKSFAPSWFQKVFSGLTDDPQGASVYANTFMETMQALAATGDYDLTTPEGQEKLYGAARSKAKILTIMRGMIQFLGPARATPEFEIATKEGDVLASELTKALYEMQNDEAAGGYQTAVQRFIDTFGEDVFIYLGRKTRSVTGGLEASTTFGKFERENDAFFDRHKTVAGYFAPGGSNFDFQVYARQLQKGRRERLTPQELLDEAQRTIGFSFYKAMRDKAGPYPNEAQRDYLRGYREFLIKQYPGFGKGSIKTDQEKENMVRELRAAASDPDMAGNKAAEGIRIYLDARDRAIEEAKKAGLTSLAGKAMAPVRDYLRHFGDVVAADNNDFGRVWERFLSYEVDLNA
jgi:hypothetical protein